MKQYIETVDVRTFKRGDIVLVGSDNQKVTFIKASRNGIDKSWQARIHGEQYDRISIISGRYKLRPTGMIDEEEIEKVNEEIKHKDEELKKIEKIELERKRKKEEELSIKMIIEAEKRVKVAEKTNLAKSIISYDVEDSEKLNYILLVLAKISRYYYIVSSFCALSFLILLYSAFIKNMEWFTISLIALSITGIISLGLYFTFIKSYHKLLFPRIKELYPNLSFSKSEKLEKNLLPFKAKYNNTSNVLKGTIGGVNFVSSDIHLQNEKKKKLGNVKVDYYVGRLFILTFPNKLNDKSILDICYKRIIELTNETAKYEIKDNKVLIYVNNFKNTLNYVEMKEETAKIKIFRHLHLLKVFEAIIKTIE